MRSQLRRLALAVALFLTGATPVLAQEADPSQQVRQSLGEVKAWLGGYAGGWGEYLNLTALENQLQAGNQADPAVVGDVLRRLESGAPGLERPRFERLRSALRRWRDQLVINRAPSLSDAALAAEANFSPVTPQQVEAARAQLRDAAGRLDKFLEASGANGQNWKMYLRWTDLQAQIEAAEPDLKVLHEIERLFSANEPGLERPVYSDVRKAIGRFAGLAATQKEDQPAEFRAQLQGLSEELKQYQAEESGELASAIGERLGWLAQRDQLPALRAAIRSQSSRPNLRVAASERLLDAGIGQGVDEVGPVRDCILGTDIHGTSHTVGRLGINLTPSQANAQMELKLRGRVNSNTVGYNGPATIYSTSTASIDGTKRIVLDLNGLASHRATACATLNSNINCVSARGPLVQRIASRRAQQSKPEAEQIGAQHAAQRVSDRLERQANEQLSKAQRDFLDRVRNPLLRRGDLPEANLSSSNDALFLTALGAQPYQLGAPVASPPIRVPYDLALQLHETFVDNLAASELAGRTLTEAEMQKLVIDLRGSLPPQMESEEDRDPWSISFARSRPVSVQFRDGHVRITIRGSRYTSGDRDFRAMNVTADYRVETTGETTRLVRQGELEIFPPGFKPGEDRLSGQQVTLRRLLQRRFGKLFEPEIKLDGLVLPNRFRQAGLLNAEQVAAQGGWLVIAWRETGVPAPPEEPTPPAKPAPVAEPAVTIK